MSCSTGSPPCSPRPRKGCPRRPPWPSRAWPRRIAAAPSCSSAPSTARRDGCWLTRGCPFIHRPPTLSLPTSGEGNAVPRYAPRHRSRTWGVVCGRYPARAPALPRLLQRVGGGAPERLSAAGRLEPGLGAGPEGAQGLDGRAGGVADQALLLRQRRPGLLRDRRGQPARLLGPPPRAGHSGSAAGGPGGGERHQPARRLPRCRGPAAHGALSTPHPDRSGRLLDPDLPRRFRLARSLTRMPSPVRDRLGGPLLAVGSLLVFFLLAEAAFRIFGFLPERYRMTARMANARWTLLLDCFPTNPRGYFDIDLREPASREKYL